MLGTSVSGQCVPDLLYKCINRDVSGDPLNACKPSGSVFLVEEREESGALRLMLSQIFMFLFSSKVHHHVCLCAIAVISIVHEIQ